MPVKTIHIILADDDEDDNVFFKRCLPDTKHYKLTHAINGLEVMHLLANANGGATLRLPDLVILDINMPKVDGISTLEKIKKEHHLKHIPVYILTTTASDSQRKKCLELGCAGFFTKPSNLAELRTVVVKILNEVHSNQVHFHRDE